jgi:hypothetical protein
MSKRRNTHVELGSCVVCAAEYVYTRTAPVLSCSATTTSIRTTKKIEESEWCHNQDEIVKVKIRAL